MGDQPSVLLKKWFIETKRDFPWRHDPTPYRVWVSEVMLQQTRASVVVPFFLCWMERFPSIEALASATEDEVIKHWEGLGYYSRARNLLFGAKYFKEHHAGQIPCSKEALLQVKGLGPYTVGAILSFAFKKKAPAVDGNVFRVMSRYYLVEEDISLPRVQKHIYQLTEDFLPEQDPHIVMEALIELGASLCGKTPQCEMCPLHLGCGARKAGIAHLLPIKKPPRPTVYLFKEVAIIYCRGKFLLKKMPSGKVLGGLHEFFSVEKDPKGPPFEEALSSLLGAPVRWVKDLKKECYSYTHHVVELFPAIWETYSQKEVDGYVWLEAERIKLLPFSSGHRRIYAALCKEKIL